MEKGGHQEPVKPEDEIKQIVQREKLLDCAEIADLESIRDVFQPKPNNPGGSVHIFKSDTDSRRKYDVLVKMLSWIK